jgi:hypothetical protein
MLTRNFFPVKSLFSTVPSFFVANYEAACNFVEIKKTNHELFL